MPCWKPSRMYECVNTSTGEVFFRFNPGRLKVVREFPTSCGQCSGCRSKNSRQWAIRCYHESLMHENNCFLTLTVEDKYLPFVFPNGSLRYAPFQKFIRAFRKKINVPIRFFMCGEYGEKFSRPHYHSIIFGWFPDFSDRALFKSTAVGDLFTSSVVSDTWTYGFHTIGNFSIASAQYVAGYIHKKINGRLKDNWYRGRNAEFAKMSNRDGIGNSFYKKYTSDIFRRDNVVLPGGSEVVVPRYYDRLHSLYHPYHFNEVKLKRMEPNPARDARNVPERLAARKVISEQRLKLKSRSFENGGVK